MDLEILQIAADTKNNKDIKNFTHNSKYRSKICGDEIEISLVVKDNKIIDMGYQCKSCIYCQASVSLLSRKIKDKNLKEIKDFVTASEKLFEDVKVSLEKHWKDFKEILDKKNLTRKECLLLPLKTVLKALKI